MLGWEIMYKNNANDRMHTSISHTSLYYKITSSSNRAHYMYPYKNNNILLMPSFENFVKTNQIHSK